MRREPDAAPAPAPAPDFDRFLAPREIAVEQFDALARIQMGALRFQIGCARVLMFGNWR